MVDRADSLLEDRDSDENSSPSTYERLRAVLLKNWPDGPYTYALIGMLETPLAWHARGGGYAMTVKEEVWPAFRAHLAKAETS